MMYCKCFCFSFVINLMKYSRNISWKAKLWVNIFLSLERSTNFRCHSRKTSESSEHLRQNNRQNLKLLPIATRDKSFNIIEHLTKSPKRHEWTRSKLWWMKNTMTSITRSAGFTAQRLNNFFFQRWQNQQQRVQIFKVSLCDWRLVFHTSKIVTTFDAMSQRM